MPQTPPKPTEQKRYRTAGELKAALADVPDDTLLVRRGSMGFWSLAGLAAGWLEIIQVGKGRDAAHVSLDDPIFKNWKGVKGEPFKVIAFD